MGSTERRNNRLMSRGLELAVGHVEHRQADSQGENEQQRDGDFIHDCTPVGLRTRVLSIYDHLPGQKSPWRITQGEGRIVDRLSAIFRELL
jgi:hypothetical protein